MKIPESIIEKYKLTPSGEQVGQSFMQNLKVYKSGLPRFEGIRFMECDFNGNPCKFINLLNTESQKTGKVTPEFLTDLTGDWLLTLMTD